MELRHQPAYTVLLGCSCFVFSDHELYGIVMEGVQPFAGLFERCVLHGTKPVIAFVVNGTGASFCYPKFDEADEADE